MHPILFKIGKITIYTYGTILYIDLILSTFLLNKFAPKFNLDKEKVFYSLLIVLFFMYLGGKIGYYAFNEVQNSFANFIIKVINPFESGLTVLGAIVFSFVGLYISSKLFKLSLINLSDLFTFIAPLSISIGRIGCLFAGCCYGKESAWGIFLHGAVRYPTQIMESILTFLLFLYFLIELKKGNYYKGKYMINFLFFYGLIRFFVEFFRESKMAFLFFTWAQVFSFFLIIFSIILHNIIKPRENKIAKEVRENK
ncbi:MAG: prolipoprotein diacylglyceryl transferase [bacterium]